MPLNPINTTVTALHINGLGSFSFARRYLRNHNCFLFLRLLRCFNSPGLTSLVLCVQTRMTEVCLCRVAPFGYPRIYACLQLPVAFRRWPRPSSSPGTKASTVRPFYLDLFLRESFPLELPLVKLFSFFSLLYAVFKELLLFSIVC